MLTVVVGSAREPEWVGMYCVVYLVSYCTVQACALQPRLMCAHYLLSKSVPAPLAMNGENVTVVRNERFTSFKLNNSL